MDWPVMVFGRAATALLIERFAGYPDALFQRLRHPVVWLGSLVELLDNKLNLPNVSPQDGRLRGVAALAILIAAAFIPTVIIANLLDGWSWGWLAEALARQPRAFGQGLQLAPGHVARHRRQAAVGARKQSLLRLAFFQWL